MFTSKGLESPILTVCTSSNVQVFRFKLVRMKCSLKYNQANDTGLSKCQHRKQGLDSNDVANGKMAKA